MHPARHLRHTLAQCGATWRLTTFRSACRGATRPLYPALRQLPCSLPRGTEACAARQPRISVAVCLIPFSKPEQLPIKMRHTIPVPVCPVPSRNSLTPLLADSRRRASVPELRHCGISMCLPEHADPNLADVCASHIKPASPAARGAVEPQQLGSAASTATAPQPQHCGVCAVSTAHCALARAQTCAGADTRGLAVGRVHAKLWPDHNVKREVDYWTARTSRRHLTAFSS